MRGLAWALLAAALHQVYVFLSVTLASRDVDLWFFFSSDTVQYGLLYKDLFELGFHYAGWNISHAPEYLQMAWSLFLRALTPTLAAGQALEALTQPLLLALALHRLFARALGRATGLAPLVVAALLALIARGLGMDFIGFIWSNRHGFTAILAVLALTSLLSGPGATPRSLAGLALLVALGTASDLLFLAWFVAPAFAALVGSLFWPGPRAGREAGRAGLAIGAGLILGLLAFWLATPVITVGAKVAVDPGRALGALGRMADDAFAPGQLSLTLLLGLGNLVAAFATLRAARAEIRMLSLFALALSAATVAAMALTSVPFREAGYTRYLLAPELASLAALVMALATLSVRFGEGLLLGALTAVIGLGFQTLPAGVSPVTHYDPPLARCVDAAARKHGLQYGVADYWLAKYLTAFSREDLSIVPVTPRLDPFVSFSNIEWFLGGVGAKRHDRPVYTFAILGSQTPEAPGVSPSALARLGPPVAVETCFGFELHVLPAGSDERIRAQFAQNPRIREYYAGRGVAWPPPR